MVTYSAEKEKNEIFPEEKQKKIRVCTQNAPKNEKNALFSDRKSAKKKPRKHSVYKAFRENRRDWIRTSDLYVPNELKRVLWRFVTFYNARSNTVITRFSRLFCFLLFYGVF